MKNTRTLVVPITTVSYVTRINGQEPAVNTQDFVGVISQKKATELLVANAPDNVKIKVFETTRTQTQYEINSQLLYEFVASHGGKIIKLTDSNGAETGD